MINEFVTITTTTRGERILSNASLNDRTFYENHWYNNRNILKEGVVCGTIFVGDEYGDKMNAYIVCDKNNITLEACYLPNELAVKKVLSVDVTNILDWLEDNNV